MIRFFFLIPVILLAGGCVTADPKAALSEVSAQLSTRADLPVSWPTDDKARQASDNTVNTLLAQDLTIDNAVRIALLNNRSLRVTLEELGLSQADLASAARLANPSFSASVRWPHDAPRTPNVEFGLTLEVLDAFLLPLRRQLAEDQLAITQQRVTYAILALISEVKMASYELLARQDDLVRVKTLTAINHAAADLARRQFDAGNINELALASIQAMAQQSQLDQLHAEAGLRAAREKINRLLALHGAQTQWSFTGPLSELPAADALPADLETLALARRLDLSAARAEVVRADKNLSIKRRTRLLPVGVTLGADTERDSDGSRKTGPNIEIALPIFDQGQAEIARLSAHSRQASEFAEALASDIRSEIRSATDHLSTARQTVEFYQKTFLPQRQRLLQQTLLHYNAMQVSVYVLLEAKDQQQRAEQAAIDARRDYWLARTELEHALGGKL